MQFLGLHNFFLRGGAAVAIKGLCWTLNPEVGSSIPTLGMVVLNLIIN